MSEKKRSPILTCLIVFLIIGAIGLCGILVIGGGGYYLVTSGQLSLNDVLEFAGFGPSEIQIYNLADDVLYVELEYYNTDTSEWSSYRSMDINSFDIKSIRNLEAGEYEISFETDSGLPEGGICALNLRRNTDLRFVAIPEGIGVVIDGEDIESAEDFDILTSEICQP